jgi:hypothetical protein
MDSDSREPARKKLEELEKYDNILKQAEDAIRSALHESPIKPGAPEFIKSRQKTPATSVAGSSGTASGKPSSGKPGFQKEQEPLPKEGESAAAGSKKESMDDSLARIHLEIKGLKGEIEPRMRRLEEIVSRSGKPGSAGSRPAREDDALRKSENEKLEMLSREVEAVKKALSGRDSASHKILRDSVEGMRKEVEDLKSRMVTLPSKNDYLEIRKALEGGPFRLARAGAKRRTMDEVKERVMRLPKPGEAPLPRDENIYGRMDNLEKRVSQQAERNSQRVSHVLDALDALSSKLASGISTSEGADPMVSQLAGNIEFFTKRFSGELSEIRDQLDRLLSLEKSVNDIRERLREHERPDAAAGKGGKRPKKGDWRSLPLPPSPEGLQESSTPGAGQSYPEEQSDDVELLREEVSERLARNETRERIVRDLLNAGFSEGLIIKAMKSLRK